MQSMPHAFKPKYIVSRNSLTWLLWFERRDHAAICVSPSSEGSQKCISAPYDSHKYLRMKSVFLPQQIY